MFTDCTFLEKKIKIKNTQNLSLKGKENYNSFSVFRHHSPNNCYMQFKFLNRCGMGLDMESRLLLLLIIFKDWGEKTLRRAKFESPVPGWVFFLSSPLSSSFFFNWTAINGIPANHLVSLVWRLTDSSPCQSAFGFATLGPLSLSLFLPHSLTQLSL